VVEESLGQCTRSHRSDSVPEYESIDTEHFLSRLLGKKHTHGLATPLLRDRVWRRQLRRAVMHLGRYIESNVTSTDAVHRHRLEEAIAQLGERVDLPQGLLREQALVTALIDLCLELLGGAPNHWHRKSLNKPHHFVLKRHRTLLFVQAPDQQAHLIADRARRADLVGLTKAQADDVDDRYWRAVRRKNYGPFVSWFRHAYPEAYVAVFV
jgi:hypothetical protein